MNYETCVDPALEQEAEMERRAVMRVVSSRGSVPAVEVSEYRSNREMEDISPYERVVYLVEHCLSVALVWRNTVETEDVQEIQSTWKPAPR